MAVDDSDETLSTDAGQSPTSPQPGPLQVEANEASQSDATALANLPTPQPVTEANTTKAPPEPPTYVAYPHVIRLVHPINEIPPSTQEEVYAHDALAEALAMERHRKLSYAVMEPDTWPIMFTDKLARSRSLIAWQAHVQTLVQEWTNTNLITALILSAAVSAFAIPGISDVGRYALIFSLISSMASLAQATYHSSYYNSMLQDQHYAVLQLRCYLSCYRPITNFLLCQPMVNLIFSMAGFSVAIISLLWPAPQNATSDAVWISTTAAKAIFPLIYAAQLGMIGISYKWNRSLFFTVNELLGGEESRKAKLWEMEERRGEEVLAKTRKDQESALDVPVISRMMSPIDQKLSAAARKSKDTGGPPTQWTAGSMFNIPSGAVPLGFQPSIPDQLYIGRASYGGRIHFGKISQNLGGANIACDGKELDWVIDYDVLCGVMESFLWLKIHELDVFRGEPLAHAPEYTYVSSPRGPAGRRVYAAAVDINGERQLGEVVEGSGFASIPYGGRETRVQEFFVLYLLSNSVRDAPDDDAAEGSTSHVSGNRNDDRDSAEDPRSGPHRRKPTREEKKSRKGQNKGRRFQKVRDEVELCWKIATGKECEFGAECRNTHDIQAYLAVKTRDIYFPPVELITDEPPFVKPSEDAIMVDESSPSIDPTTRCPVHTVRGECKTGLKCRFLGAHVRKTDTGSYEMTVDEERQALSAVTEAELNFVGADTLKKLRSKKYPYPISDAYLKRLQVEGDAQNAQKPSTAPEVVVVSEPTQGGTVVQTNETVVDLAPSASAPKDTGTTDAQIDTPDVPMRPAEKKRLHWSGKTYLAPLTTVGNLPFRRLCVDYGADITCGEMGLANSFLGGSKEEWSLVRRHPSEKIFGIQVAGSRPSLLVPTAEVIAKELAGNLDFVDINCGCPIDLVFKTGSGSALLDSAGKLGKILVGMNKALGEIPVTVKLRSGVKDGRNNAHKLMPRLGCEWNAAALTLHGRTRQQRYSKLADWDYVKACVDAVRAREAEEDLHPIPIFGGGDVFSSEDYWEKVDSSGVDGVMIGRGALIKPWVFTEVKERREWDISARERLELIRKYAEYGLNHFGSDTPGVNTTRRYFCEALSFQYRYIPIGLLEHLPPRINDRAPGFKGRSELETLLGSGNSQDWVKISEMFLGPAPEGWTFTPKHKSNAYGSEESQG
ncbi:hypothetical protein EUX98_g4689 [Antrodiella citrinella]|uniref:tRNA-dihydrouridine(47) synthase [NAD(P)(+)] n=1 Tax=Antrodiella citrinella TaxID=2447956 RepID=A0A4S4MW44_9APHY|nr:hypothetical protein EUX98_g4689 [Antrodiella citrinella]